jgi:hypothetical protein
MPRRPKYEIEPGSVTTARSGSGKTMYIFGALRSRTYTLFGERVSWVTGFLSGPGFKAQIRGKK